jgi:hypothetical protein
VACWYIFSWRFGQSALTVGVMAFIALAIIPTFALNLDRWDWIGAPGIAAARWLAGGPWYLQLCPFLIALAAYYGLMQVAIRVKQKSEASL